MPSNAAHALCVVFSEDTLDSMLESMCATSCIAEQWPPHLGFGCWGRDRTMVTAMSLRLWRWHQQDDGGRIIPMSGYYDSLATTFPRSTMTTVCPQRWLPLPHSGESLVFFLYPCPLRWSSHRDVVDCGVGNWVNDLGLVLWWCSSDHHTICFCDALVKISPCAG